MSKVSAETRYMVLLHFARLKVHLPSAAAACATVERLHGCRLLQERPADGQVLAGLLRIAVLRGAACGLTAAEGGQVQRDSMADAIGLTVYAQVRGVWELRLWW